MFDISSVGLIDQATVELNDAAGRPLFNDRGERCSITLFGPPSKEYQQAKSNLYRRMVNRQIDGDNVLASISPEEQQEMYAEFLASCTVSFNGFDYKGGQDFKAAYGDPALEFVFDQVKTFVDSKANFTKGSDKT